MPRIIYKYQLTDGVVITLPSDVYEYNIVHVREQHGVPCMWIELFRDDRIYDTKIQLMVRIIGTGQNLPVDLDLEYKGTCFINNEVWHIYVE